MDEMVNRVLKGEKLADVLGHTKRRRKPKFISNDVKHENAMAYIKAKKAFNKFWSKG